MSDQINPNLAPSPAKSSHWKFIAAYVYLAICVFDFVVMPTLTFFFHTPPASIVTLIGSLNVNVQPDLIKDFYAPWQPLTENDGAIFHIIFLTLLGVISWKDSNVEMAKADAQKQVETLKAQTSNQQPNSEPKG